MTILFNTGEKMKKLSLIILAAITLSLTACNTQVSDSPSNTSDISETSEISEAPTSESDDYVFDPEIYNNIELSGGEQDGDLYILDGYGYIGLFDRKCYDSIESPELFGDDMYDYFLSLEDSSKLKYFRMDVGDTAAGLTCTEAKTTYAVTDSGENFLQESTLSFDGELNVTGYAYLCGKDEAYFSEGDIRFVPSVDGWDGMPIPFKTEPDVYMFEEQLFYAPLTVDLGGAEKNAAFDIFDGDSRLEHVSLTLDNLCVKYSEISITWVSAEIVDFKMLD